MSLSSSSQGLRRIAKPSPEEYTAASEQYIRLVPVDGPVLDLLKENAALISNLFLSVTPLNLGYRYDEGKWTLREVLQHLIDDERIYAYRALCFGRNEQKQLQGFDQDSYIQYARAGEREIQSLVEEYLIVRSATIALFSGLPEDALTRMGSTNEFIASVRALLYHIAGHELNHLRIIREKYQV